MEYALEPSVAGPRNRPAPRHAKPRLGSPLRHERLRHRECHSHRAMSGDWPLLTATSATDQKAEKSLRRRRCGRSTTRTVNPEVAGSSPVEPAINQELR